MRDGHPDRGFDLVGGGARDDQRGPRVVFLVGGTRHEHDHSTRQPFVELCHGGIGQGLTATGEALQATGFWFMASLAVSPRLSCNLGYSQDDPDDKDLAVDARALNSSIWLNGWFTLDRNTKLGLEAGSWNTEYKTATATTSVDALRLQSSLLFSF